MATRSSLDTVPGVCPVSRRHVLWVTVPCTFVSGEGVTGSAGEFIALNGRGGRGNPEKTVATGAIDIRSRREPPSRRETM